MADGLVEICAMVLHRGKYVVFFSARTLQLCCCSDRVLSHQGIIGIWGIGFHAYNYDYRRVLFVFRFRKDMYVCRLQVNMPRRLFLVRIQPLIWKELFDVQVCVFSVYVVSP